MLTHAARAAAKQLNKLFRRLWWPRAARAKGSGQSNKIGTVVASLPARARAAHEPHSYAAASRVYGGVAGQVFLNKKLFKNLMIFL